MRIPPRLVTHHLLGAAAACGIFAGAAHVATAGSAGAPLAVVVTVARSCSVHAQPSGPSASLLTIGCASGATSGVLLGDSSETSVVPRRGQTFYVRTETFSPRSSLQVVTVNF